jgi:hypothetical protein
MAGLVPAIHVLINRRKKDVDARDKPGHDVGRASKKKARVSGPPKLTQLTKNN